MKTDGGREIGPTTQNILKHSATGPKNPTGFLAIAVFKAASLRVAEDIVHCSLNKLQRRSMSKAL